MLADARGESRAARPALLTAGVLGIFAVVLVAGLIVLLVVRGHHASPGLTSREQAAMDAASREMVALQTFRLAHFDSDFARARDGLTGELAKAFSGKKSALKAGLQKSKLDTSAAVTQAAFEHFQGDSALVLMTVNNYRIDAKGKKTLFTSGRFEVTVNEVEGRWLASNLTSVGLM